MTDWPSRITHLTNLAIQKRHPQFKERKEEVAISVEALGKYLEETNGTTKEEFKEKVTGRI